MKNRFQAVIFDFDFTLADASRAVIDCIGFALSELGLPEVSAESARRTIGMTLTETFRKLAGQDQMDLSDEFARLFQKRADEVMVDKTTLFEPVPETIENLTTNGLVLGIVSTKFRFRIEATLRRENLQDRFKVIIGNEDVSNHKPDPEGLLKAIKTMGSTPANSLYVGDSVIDAEAAQRASVPFVAVLSGVTPREKFKEYPFYRIIDSLSDMPRLME